MPSIMHFTIEFLTIMFKQQCCAAFCLGYPVFSPPFCTDMWEYTWVIPNVLIQTCQFSAFDWHKKG